MSKITFHAVRTTLSGRDSTCGTIREWMICRDGVKIAARNTYKECKLAHPDGKKA